MTTHHTIMNQVKQRPRLSKCLVLVLLIITGAILSVNGNPIPSGRGNRNKGREKAVDYLRELELGLYNLFDTDKRGLTNTFKQCAYHVGYSGGKPVMLGQSIIDLWSSFGGDVTNMIKLLRTKQSYNREFNIPSYSVPDPPPDTLPKKKLHSFERIKLLKQSMDCHRNAMSDVMEQIKGVIVDAEDMQKFESYRDSMVCIIDAMEWYLRFYVGEKMPSKVEAIWGTGSDAAVNAQSGTSSGQTPYGQTNVDPLLGTGHGDAASNAQPGASSGTNLESRPDYWLSH